MINSIEFAPSSGRVFEEVGEEVDVTAQYYADGLEKKEIAEKKCRSIHTITAQLQKIFDVLDITNRSQLTKEYCKRIYHLETTQKIIKTTLTVIFISMSFYIQFKPNTDEYTRGKNQRITKVISFKRGKETI